MNKNINPKLTGKLFALSLAVASLASLYSTKATGDQTIKAMSKVGEGLNTTTFQTPQGKISVNLPEDMAAGDTLTGTVIAEAEGKSPEEKAQNTDELNGYVVEVRKAEQPPPPENMEVAVEPKPAKGKKKPPKAKCTDHSIGCLLPALGNAIELVLINKDNTDVCSNEVPIPKMPTSTCPTNGCTMPQVGQCGKPVTIHTPCDGSFNNSGVTVGDKPCELLAEGPRTMIAKSPTNVVGPTQIKMNEGKHTATGKFTNLRVKLAAQKLVLQKGESTTMTVTVFGMEGLTGPVKLHVQNNTPGNVSVDGGNSQDIMIQPSGREQNLIRR